MNEIQTALNKLDAALARARLDRHERADIEDRLQGLVAVVSAELQKKEPPFRAPEDPPSA